MNPKIVVCASGEGSLFEAIVRATRNGVLPAEVVGLIVNRKGIGALARAERLGVAASLISLRAFPSSEAWDEGMLNQLRVWKADWVALGGFLAKVGPSVLRAFPNRIINTHPGLLPEFGGQGMYGDYVHAAVLKSGLRETGITIHLVNEQYDSGKVIALERVPVLPDDSVSSLATRVKNREAQLYPRVLADLITGRINLS